MHFNKFPFGRQQPPSQKEQEQELNKEPESVSETGHF